VSNGALAGCGVLITRPEHQSHELAAAIGAANGAVYQFPAIDIVGRDLDEIQHDFGTLPAPDIVVFVSSNAVVHGIAVVKGDTAKIAVVGPATRAAVEAAGMAADIYPEVGFDSEQLLEHPALQEVSGRNVLIMRGQSGRELLADTLAERGANVDCLRVYSRIPHEPAPSQLEMLDSILPRGRVHFIIVMSVATLECLVQILPSQSLGLLRQSTLVAPSTRVLQTASELIPGIATELAPGPQAPTMVDTLIRLWHTG